MKYGRESIATPTRTLAVVTSVVTPRRTTTPSPERMREKRWIPTCYHCNRRRHIRSKCYQYFAYLRRANQERFPPRRVVKQE